MLNKLIAEQTAILEEIEDTIARMDKTELVCPKAHDHHVAHLNVLEQDASRHMAVTPEMAILQIGVLKGVVDMLANASENTPSTDDLQHAAERIANGLIRFIETSHASCRDRYGAYYFCSGAEELAAWRLPASALGSMIDAQRKAIRPVSLSSIMAA